MGTRSYIVIKKENCFEAIYCHWDGYPGGNGVILRDHYTDPQKVKDLINLGDISSLAPEIGEKHGFQERDCGVIAYHRDRNEEWKAVKPKEYRTLHEVSIQAKESWAEWMYLFDDGQWFYRRCDDEFLKEWNKVVDIV